MIDVLCFCCFLTSCPAQELFKAEALKILPWTARIFPAADFFKLDRTQGKQQKSWLMFQRRGCCSSLLLFFKTTEQHKKF
jgi:hypothetical protein